jgi:NAD(P)H dehydrogenase (quinone)
MFDRQNAQTTTNEKRSGRMKALIVYSHPNPQSFNAAILGVVKEELEKKQAEIKVKDLYAMNWNPVLSASDFRHLLSGQRPDDIAREQDDVAWADWVILISPVWWFSVTSMLRGWIDRVFTEGFAYRFGEQGARGLLEGKRGLLITTSGASQAEARASGMLEVVDTLFVKALFGFSGFSGARHYNCFGVTRVSDAERQNMLREVADFVATGVS